MNAPPSATLRRAFTQIFSEKGGVPFPAGFLIFRQTLRTSSFLSVRHKFLASIAVAPPGLLGYTVTLTVTNKRAARRLPGFVWPARPARGPFSGRAVPKGLRGREEGGFFTKYLFQFARILAFCFLGEFCHAVLPLPIPASIYGLVLLLAALLLGLVQLDDVKEVGLFLTGIFPLLFVPAAAGVMELWAEMGSMLLPIVIAIIPVTVLVLVTSGHTTQALTRRKQSKKEAAANDTAAE